MLIITQNNNNHPIKIITQNTENISLRKARTSGKKEEEKNIFQN